MGGLGVLDISLLGECDVNCCKRDRDRARRRGGGVGANLDAGDGDARADAREEATMALERASSLIPFESCSKLEVLLFDATDIDPILGVFPRTNDPLPTGFFLIDPVVDCIEDV